MVYLESSHLDTDALSQRITEERGDAGAIVTFSGYMRSTDKHGRELQAMFLEHYPGMTESVLEKIISQVKQDTLADTILVAHRVGRIELNDAIVFVGVSASHRQQAFNAAEMLMDFLKNDAPFWKKEQTLDGEWHWVEQKQSDRDALTKWQKKACNEQA